MSESMFLSFGVSLITLITQLHPSVHPFALPSVSYQDKEKTMMCSYKLVEASFEVWGLQGKVESYMHKVRA